MNPVLSSAFFRTIVFAGIIVVTSCVLPGAAAADKVQVNCALAGQTISSALAANSGVENLVLVVKGTCTENVVITRDDLTIQTNGVTPAFIVAADNSQPAVHLDGARRSLINGRI